MNNSVSVFDRIRYWIILKQTDMFYHNNSKFDVELGSLWLISKLICRRKKLEQFCFACGGWGGRLVFWVVRRLSQANYCISHVLLATFHAYLWRLGLCHHKRPICYSVFSSHCAWWIVFQACIDLFLFTNTVFTLQTDCRVIINYKHLFV